MRAIDRTDALRSLRRYVGLILKAKDSAWDIQFARAEPNPRPIATISAMGPQVSDAHGSAYVRHPQQNYELFVYPLGVPGNPFASKLEAEALASYLDDCFQQGFAEGYCMRVPIYDYGGVPWDQSFDPVTQPEPYDFAPADRFQVNVMVDAGQDDLYNLTLDIRLSWEAAGDTRRFRGAILADVPIKPGQGVG